MEKTTEGRPKIGRKNKSCPRTCWKNDIQQIAGANEIGEAGERTD